MKDKRKLRLFYAIFIPICIAGFGLILYLMYLFFTCYGCPYVDLGVQP